ncbi:hypothetical protein IFM89_028687 [Coptis chinensis]|uniref:Beta-amylase n=1 Tax=Coptis chinensis TaxID=261450 RepID=A0A835J2N8_9MAGN|nr:hypothetical protein IFM89_028687 [Coptis chinensis]
MNDLLLPDPASDNSSDQQPPQQRRPRGFAARNNNNNNSTESSTGKVVGKKEREREKERTKLRERHRRAITSRMLAGLRQHGNFTLPARADMNDVLAALAREAGWIVEADGTTYRPSPPLPALQLAPFPARQTECPLKIKSSLECPQSILRTEDSLSPGSLDSVVVAGRDLKSENYASASPINSSDCFQADQLMDDIRSVENGDDFTGTPNVPVYVMLSTGVINNFCQLIDPEGIRDELRHLKSLHVDGVVVHCWWGIVESWSPQKYLWAGYRELFSIIRGFKMKIQVVMAFHECGGNGSGDNPISLPKWVLEIGKDNQDIFFMDREGRRNTEYLSWGVDKERVLRGRTGIEVYYDFMRSFRMEFDDLFMESTISAVEIGLGASGELKYPSFTERIGWRYPGVGEFQCYDKYLQQSLRKASNLRGHSFWARGPDNAGQYNSRPQETGFFCDRGDYDSYYGRFFLQWYSKTLIDHADNVLCLANLAFEGTQLIVKIPAIYWWYRTTSHAAELTAGFYNPTNQDGYSSVFEVLKKHSVTLKFVCSGLQSSAPENGEASADLEGLIWQVLNSAWERGLTIAGQNALPCYDREGYTRIVEIAKPMNDPDHRHLLFFVYQQPSPLTQRDYGFSELDSFIRCMHGKHLNLLNVNLLELIILVLSP